jgi:hypothetical protein
VRATTGLHPCLREAATGSTRFRYAAGGCVSYDSGEGSSGDYGFLIGITFMVRRLRIVVEITKVVYRVGQRWGIGTREHSAFDLDPLMLALWLRPGPPRGSTQASL